MSDENKQAKTKPKSNIVLIGMPGAGKSTLGILLAKELGKSFIDTDVLIQVKHQQTLQSILDNQGYQALRAIEEEVLLENSFHNHVVATGGSAVYSEVGMRHLLADGLIVFLDPSIEQLKLRIHNYETRGIAKKADQSFADLYAERKALYQRYANLVLSCDSLSMEETLQKLLVSLEKVL